MHILTFKKIILDSSDEESDESEDEEAEEEKKEKKNVVNEKLELRKQFFLSKINPFQVQDTFSKVESQHTYIDYESAELVSRYLSSKRQFSKSFETFLKHVSISLILLFS